MKLSFDAAGLGVALLASGTAVAQPLNFDQAA